MEVILLVNYYCGERVLQVDSKGLILGKRQLRQIVGHCDLRVHLFRIGIFHGEAVCRLCELDKETAGYVSYDCSVLSATEIGCLVS